MDVLSYDVMTSEFFDAQRNVVAQCRSERSIFVGHCDVKRDALALPINDVLDLVVEANVKASIEEEVLLQTSAFDVGARAQVHGVGEDWAEVEKICFRVVVVLRAQTVSPATME